ncbi:MAG: hypothetical protein ABWJ42_02610 [Sulfolobales archaeon]
MRDRIRVLSIGYGNSIQNTLRFLDQVRSSESVREWVWHERVGRFYVDDVEFVGIVDIDCKKINSESSKISIFRGILLDEIKILREAIGSLCTCSEDEFRREIKDLEFDVGVIAINSGETATSRRYAEILLEKGAAVINMTPEELARDRGLQERFLSERRIIVGDDLLSQAGGTILHKYLIRFFSERGFKVLRSYQLDVAGTLETLVTTDESIRLKKRSIKSDSIKIEGSERVVAGTTDYVPFLEDQRISHIFIEIMAPLNKIFKLEARYWSYDGVNAVNTLLDVIRAVAYSIREHREDLRLLEEDANIISVYGFKAPPKILRFEEAFKLFEERFIF